MGGFNPITTLLGTVGGLARKGNDAYNASENYRQAQETYAFQERQIAEQRKNELRQIQAESDAEASRRRSALKRTVARQRAEFGGQGIDAADGSGQAVLLGLFEESADERKYRDKLDAIKRASLDSDTSAKSNRNLLALRSNYAGLRNSLVDLI